MKHYWQWELLKEFENSKSNMKNGEEGSVITRSNIINRSDYAKYSRWNLVVLHFLYGVSEVVNQPGVYIRASVLQTVRHRHRLSQRDYHKCFQAAVDAAGIGFNDGNLLDFSFLGVCEGDLLEEQNGDDDDE
nr:hypothetical protein Iba_chr04bCG19290 [Ipomoea batatas]